MDWRDVNRKDVYWWTKEAAEALPCLNADFDQLVNDNSRLEAYDTYASLYTNRRIDPAGPLLGGFEAEWAITRGKYTRCPFNLMKQVIDEVTSRITKSHPKARFLTHGGNRSLQRRAKLMERWNDAQVYRLQENKLFDQVIMDACLYGLGALKFYKAPKEDRVCAEREFAGNLFVDINETMFGMPTRLHHRRFVSKVALATLFPEFGEEIRQAGMISDHARYTSYYNESDDQCELVESWHLPSYLDKKGNSPDGVRYLWVDKQILQKTSYNRRDFPFAFFTWKEDPYNRFYGIGLAEDLLGVHIDANITLRRVNTAIEFIPNPYVVVRQGSKVQAADITNAPGTIIEYSGPDAPQIVSPPTVPGDLLQYVREHEMRAYKIAGLAGVQSAGDRVPSGLETGAAVENYFQVESVPFSTQLKKFEHFVQAVAENNVSIGREIFSKNPKFTVVIPQDRYTVEELDWKEVSIDPREDSYVIRSSPTSALSETPAARLAQVERLALMFPAMAEQTKRDLLNMPDLEKENDLATATKSNTDMMIEKALDDGVFTPPSPFMDLDLFIIRANAEEQRGHDTGVPEQHLAILRRMILRANELRQRQIIAANVQQQGLMTPTAVAQQPQAGQGPTAVQG